ncbi:MAG: hypothetical protein ACPGO5_03100 [Patescibacteria group bacterium]
MATSTKKEGKKKRVWWVDFWTRAVEIQAGRKVVRAYQPVPKELVNTNGGESFNIKLLQTINLSDGSTKFLVKVLGRKYEDFRVIYCNWSLGKGPGFSVVNAKDNSASGGTNHLAGFDVSLMSKTDVPEKRKKSA